MFPPPVLRLRISIGGTGLQRVSLGHATSTLIVESKHARSFGVASRRRQRITVGHHSSEGDRAKKCAQTPPRLPSRRQYMRSALPKPVVKSSPHALSAWRPDRRPALAGAAGR